MQGMCTGVGGKTNFDEDINASCIREVKEETGLDVPDVTLKGVIKTVLAEKDSSWILFVYTANRFNGSLINCDEGELTWVGYDEIYSQNIIGFIKKILPYVLGDYFIEGTIKHDMTGNIIEDKLIKRQVINPTSAK